MLLIVTSSFSLKFSNIHYDFISHVSDILKVKIRFIRVHSMLSFILLNILYYTVT